MTRAHGGVVVAAVLLLSGCATAPPRQPDNICSIFREKPSWHSAAVRTQKKWGLPPQVAFAMLYQESSFRHDAQPPRRFILGFIPWGRISTAYGYAQAKDETWADYKRETSRWVASRSNFSDALDFMGWYTDKSSRINRVSKWDAYGQYLNYHEGWTGYKNGSYNRKQWLIGVAQKVDARAKQFGGQYNACKDSLNSSWFF